MLINTNTTTTGFFYFLYSTSPFILFLILLTLYSTPIFFYFSLYNLPYILPPLFYFSCNLPTHIQGQTLFGMDLARHHIASVKHAVVVEGYFDVIAMHDVGMVNAVGNTPTPLDTTHSYVPSNILTPHISIYLRYLLAGLLTRLHACLCCLLVDTVGSLGTAVTKAQLDLAAKWTHSAIVNAPVKSAGRGDDFLTGPVKSFMSGPVKSPALILLMDDDKVLHRYTALFNYNNYFNNYNIIYRTITGDC